jgi:hypothetical protein
MRKVTISLVTSVLIILSPVLVQPQGFGAGGFRGGGFGGISRGSTVSGFRGGFSNGGVTPTFRGVDLGSSTGFVSSGFGQRGFDSRFSTLTRSSRFGSTSNSTPSNLNTDTLESQLPNAIGPKARLLQPVHRFKNFSRGSSKGFVNSGFDQSTTSNLTPSNLNTHILTPRFPNAIDPKARLVQPIDRLKSFSSSSFTRTNDFKSNSLRNKVITNEEGNTPPDNLSTSPTTTEIIHWVDRRNGVMHFTNRISSIPKGEETTIVTGKKAVSTSRESNVGSTLTPSQSSKHTLSLTSESTVGLAMRGTTNSINSDNGSVVDDSSGSTRTKVVFNFFFGTPFFVSPFSFFPGFSFFLGFNSFNSFFSNPFLFQSLFFPEFFNSFVFQPLFPSPFITTFLFPPIAPLFSPLFNPFPFGMNFSPNAFIFNDLNIN